MEKNRQLWSVQDVNIIYENIKILGINYSNTYDLAIQDSWEKIIDSIKIKINLLMNRKHNLYQKAININCMIFSKVWYTCHIYPLSIEQAKHRKAHFSIYMELKV